jgi:iron uptake system component EfeO
MRCEPTATATSLLGMPILTGGRSRAVGDVACRTRRSSDGGPSWVRWPAVVGATIGLPVAGLVAGCSGSPRAENATPAKNVINVSRATCGSGWQDPSPGVQTLQIHNTSAVVVEVTLVSSSTGAIHARVEGIGPRTTRAMPVDVGSGSYAFECFGTNYGYQVSRSIRIPGHVRGGVGIMPVNTPAMNTVTTESEAYVARGLAVVARLTTVLAAKIRAGHLAAAPGRLAARSPGLGAAGQRLRDVQLL